MLNVHDQCISLNKLMCSASLDAGFFTNAMVSISGKIPRTENSIIPGIKKLLKGEFSNSDNGKPINSIPKRQKWCIVRSREEIKKVSLFNLIFWALAFVQYG